MLALDSVTCWLFEWNISEICLDPLHLFFMCVLQKAQPNGRAVAEPQEEAIVSEEIVPHHQPPPPEVKAEKVAEVISCTKDIC